MSTQSNDFDPYRKWLGIPPEEQPPTHYRLLGIAVFESDPEVIQESADRQMGHIRTHQTGPFSSASQRVLNEIAVAMVQLLNPQKKAAYDQRLRGELAARDAQRAPPGTSFYSPVAPQGPVYSSPTSMTSGGPTPYVPTAFAPGYSPAAVPYAPVGVPSAMPVPVSHEQFPAAASGYPPSVMPGAMPTASSFQDSRIGRFQEPNVPIQAPVEIVSPATVPTDAAPTEAAPEEPAATGRPLWFWPAAGLMAVLVLVSIAWLSNSRQNAAPRVNRPKQTATGQKPGPLKPRPGATQTKTEFVGAAPQGPLPTSTRSGQPTRPPPPGFDMPVDLLDLIDTDRDTKRGAWKFVGSSLFSPSDGLARLKVPYSLPPEYTLSIAVERMVGQESLNLVLASGDVQFAVLLDARAGRVSGLQLVDDKTVMANETTFDGSVFTNQQPAKVVCTVRKTGVSVSVDGRSIIDFKGRVDRLSMDSGWDLPERDVLFLGTLDSVFMISKLELAPLSARQP